MYNCRVVALSVSPVDDKFISGSLDNTIRLWDLRSPNCQVSVCVCVCVCVCLKNSPECVHVNIVCFCVLQGLTNPLGKPVCCFDPEGLIFAAGVNSEMINLYDIRSFDKVNSCLWMSNKAYCVKSFCLLIIESK